MILAADLSDVLLATGIFLGGLIGTGLGFLLKRGFEKFDRFGERLDTVVGEHVALSTELQHHMHSDDALRQGIEDVRDGVSDVRERMARLEGRTDAVAAEQAAMFRRLDRHMKNEEGDWK